MIKFMHNIRYSHNLLIFLFFIFNLLTCSSHASPFDLSFTDHDQIENFITKQTRLIAKHSNESKSAAHLLQRGDAYFLLNKFDKAVDDYTKALTLDSNQIEAHFGRGLALARSGWIEEGIVELTLYINKNPNSSAAYTKRGVRRLWLGEQDAAQKDFERALEIDPGNAEAHDDLGVIFSRKQQYYQAADHFISAIEFDPTYQKAYHNLALISYLTGKDELALQFVDTAVELNAFARDSLLLKSQILAALGYTKASEEAKEEAAFLPEGNWSELVPIQ